MISTVRYGFVRTFSTAPRVQEPLKIQIEGFTKKELASLMKKGSQVSLKCGLNTTEADLKLTRAFLIHAWKQGQKLEANLSSITDFDEQKFKWDHRLSLIESKEVILKNRISLTSEEDIDKAVDEVRKMGHAYRVEFSIRPSKLP